MQRLAGKFEGRLMRLLAPGMTRDDIKARAWAKYAELARAAKVDTLDPNTTTVPVRPGRLRNVVIGLLAMFVGVPYLVGIIAHPWSSRLLGPVLVGDWYGEMALPDGRIIPIALELESRKRYRKRRDNLLGTAQTCDGGTEIQRHWFSGNTRTWSGTRLYLGPQDRGQEHPTLPRLEGQWSKDTLRLSMLVLQDSSGPAQPREVTFTLVRGKAGDFRAACARLGAQRGGENA